MKKRPDREVGRDAAAARSTEPASGSRGQRTLGRERLGALGSIVHRRAASDPALTVALGCTHRPGGVEVAVSRHQLLAVHRHAPSTAVGGIDLELMAEDDAVPAFLRSGPHAFRVFFAEPPGGVAPYESIARGGCHLSPDCGTGPDRTLPPRVAGTAWAGRPRRGGRPRPRSSRRCGGTPRSAPGPARRALSRRSVRRTFDAIVLEGFAYLRAELERLAGKGGDDHDGQHVREAAHVERPGVQEQRLLEIRCRGRLLPHAEPRQQGAGERRDVLAVLAQRRRAFHCASWP